LTNIWVVEQFLGPAAEIKHETRTIQFIQKDGVRNN